MKKALTYGAVLVGGYLVLSHYRAAGSLLGSGAAGASKFARTLQGR